MQHRQRPTVAVVLPGTGFDAEFARHAFGPALAQAGIEMIAVEPEPRRVVAGYLDALDAAHAKFGPVLVAGVSIGAAVALNWAGERDDRAAAILAVLPAWTGSPDGAPASLSAAFTAAQLRELGIDAVIDTMRASSPPWLAEILTRSWRSQWPDLPEALEEASAYPSPTMPQLAKVSVPVGIAAAVDDPIHPIAVAEQWATQLPAAAVARVTLDEIGADLAVLGYAAVEGLADAGMML